ncbi:hypothetical protein Pst134EA_004664 [Puccinia striiformis f. sp. tritici]|uniref:hypothetical protein n=1 Tax=Puccinia striiformis f. sp. tritici TaxID=168172 RepID=UPI002007953F|nr:hypothetical protein Pst134EA_004664 [Puccinia striiformis f. sp. tritici]KAH9470740.1 hypothetical protein Pst134EA_004664 [Puccinia striiformis f. sp. tritici]
MQKSAVQQLVDLIAQAAKEIEADVATQLPGATITDINLPVVAPEDNLETTPKRRAALRALQAATHQLIATLTPASAYSAETYLSFYHKTAIDTVLGARIADLIHSIDPDSSKGGVHVEVLAKMACMEPRKLAHILRFLALRNIFCELTENHWANNRHSLPLCTDSSNSIVNSLGHIKEEISLPALIELPKLLLDKTQDGALSWDVHNSAFQNYYKPGCDFFEFLAKSEGGYRAERFGKAMLEMTQAIGSGASVYKAFDWHKLGLKGTLIDVGGGVGAAAYAVSSYLPGWKVVVQDRAEVITDGKENYCKIGSTANLEFEEADFFKSQPAHRSGEADAYFLRHVLHDWPFESCSQILSHLRKAAKPTTSLLICESVLSPPLVDPNSPVLSNGGMASASTYFRNLSMMTLLNAEERSHAEFAEIFKSSGWKLQSTTPLATLSDYFILEGIPDPSWETCDA